MDGISSQYLVAYIRRVVGVVNWINGLKCSLKSAMNCITHATLTLRNASF